MNEIEQIFQCVNYYTVIIFFIVINKIDKLQYYRRDCKSVILKKFSEGIKTERH